LAFPLASPLSRHSLALFDQSFRAAGQFAASPLTAHSLKTQTPWLTNGGDMAATLYALRLSAVADAKRLHLWAPLQAAAAAIEPTLETRSLAY